jgi:hypothetical protein
MGHPPSREHSSTQKGGRLSQSQRLSERRKNADQVPKINTPRNQTPIAQHPNPPHCGWDIRPPANIPRRKREGDCPNRSGCPSGEKMPTKSQPSKPSETAIPAPLPSPTALRMGHPPSRQHRLTQREGDCPNRSGWQDGQKVPTKVPNHQNPAKRPHHRHCPRPPHCGWDIRPPANTNSPKGRAIVPIAAVVLAAKKCRPSPNHQNPAKRPYPRHCPRPPHCGWDIRPPANTDSPNGRAIVPIAAAGKTAKKCSTKSRTIKNQRNGHTRAIAHAHRTADGTSALPRTPTHPKGGRLSQSQRLARRPKSARPSPNHQNPAKRPYPRHCPRPLHCRWDIRPPANTNSPNGRAIVPIAAAGETAKKCSTKSRTIKNQRNGHTRAHTRAHVPNPSPPRCGWDIRPPENIPRRKREGDCPNRSGCPSGQKMPTKFRKSIPRATKPPLPSTQTHRTADGTSALPPTFLNAKGRAIVPIAAVVRAAKNADQVPKINTPRNQTPIAQHPNPPHCGWDIRPPAPSRYKFDSR